MRLTSERFQHSTETISRFFAIGLDALTLLAAEMIKPLDPQFMNIPAKILNDDRYMPYFKDCIGAIDGTHVDACVPVDDQVRYIGRHGTPTQNIMAICDFDMCFTYVVPGWEGSAHDSRIFQRAVNDPSCEFPHPPPGKYYLVDAGYPLQRGILKPYPETRYHLPDFARGNRPISGRREIFNKAHSSLRSVIERTFGVWKKKWGILRKMPQYTVSKQCVIVVATMTLHNYIRRHPSRVDREFNACDMDANFVHRQAYELRVTRNRRATNANPNIDPVTIEGSGANEMSALRDFIADQLQHDHRYNIFY
ncbi:hypothetical protein KSP39_PZI010984 [Platanthera zijinensis]|uniref:DDE Tnp4 domain-containing protein n=1 Tax=Platanthera zijinensis TaxID=2320716 RepID=A0AAP0BG96_9ASPA